MTGSRLLLLIAMFCQSYVLYSSSYDKIQKITCPFILTYSRLEKPGVHTIATRETDSETGATQYHARLVTQHEGVVKEEKPLEGACTLFNTLNATYEQNKKTCKKSLSVCELQHIEDYQQRKNGIKRYAQRCIMFDRTVSYYAYIQRENSTKRTFPNNKEAYFKKLRAVYCKENSQEKSEFIF